MPLFELKLAGISKIPETTFDGQGVRERADLQRLLRAHIDVVSPDTFILCEEFGDWTESRRRIDLLGLDRQANLVVIELKRTEDGGHMELQAIHYAAMISTMTFEQSVIARGEYQRRCGIDGDAKSAILSFLNWPEPDENLFAQSVRVVLVAADFSKELTTSVMWLNSYELDIRCVRLRPHDLDGRTILDVQQLIPLPEVADYQVQVREKAQKERESREWNVDFTRFDVAFDGLTRAGMWKRGAILFVASNLVERGVAPDAITKAVEKPVNRLWRVVEGDVNAADFRLRAASEAMDGTAFDSRRWFCEDDELIRFEGRTYAFSNQWGGDSWHDAMRRFVLAFPQFNIKYTPIGETVATK